MSNTKHNIIKVGPGYIRQHPGTRCNNFTIQSFFTKKEPTLTPNKVTFLLKSLQADDAKAKLELSNYLWLENNIPFELSDDLIPEINLELSKLSEKFNDNIIDDEKYFQYHIERQNQWYWFATKKYTSCLPKAKIQCHKVWY